MALSTQQLQERKKGIGGSDAAAVLGLSSYKTPLDIYLDKTSDEIECVSNIYMDVGNHMEPFIRDKYASQIGVKLIQPSEICINYDYPWMRCNLDFISLDKSIVGEIKFTSYFNDKWGTQYTDDIPTEYLIQCAHNCIVAEAYYNKSYDEFPLIAFGFGKGLEMREYVYRRDSRLERKIIEAEKNFWQEHVEKNMPPEAITRLDAINTFQEVNDNTIVADDEIIDLYHEVKGLKFNLKALEDKKKKLEVDLCNRIGNSTYVLDYDGNKIVSWKEQEINRLDTIRLKKEAPELYNKYINTNKNRILRIS